MAERKFSPRRIASREKMVEMLRLKKAGASYADIATKFGCAKSLVFRLISRAMSELPREDAEQLRTMELERLDSALLVATRIMSTSNRDEMKLRAIDRIVRISERRSILMGLDVSKPAQQIEVGAGRDVSIVVSPMIRIDDDG
jgi:transposase-like protein